MINKLSFFDLYIDLAKFYCYYFQNSEISPHKFNSSIALLRAQYYQHTNPILGNT